MCMIPGIVVIVPVPQKNNMLLVKTAQAVQRVVCFPDPHVCFVFPVAVGGVNKRHPGPVVVSIPAEDSAEIVFPARMVSSS